MIIFVELLPKINDTGNESTHLTKILQILTSALNDIIRYTLFYLNRKHTLFPPGWLDMSHLLLSLIDRLFFKGLFISYEITRSLFQCYFSFSFFVIWRTIIVTEMLFCLKKKIIVFGQLPHTRLEKADTIQVLHRKLFSKH